MVPNSLGMQGHTHNCELSASSVKVVRHMEKIFWGAGLWKSEIGLDGIDDGIELAIPGAALL